MTQKKINELFELAGQYAKKAYREIFNRDPDLTNNVTREILDMMKHAWLAGYNNKERNKMIDNTLYEVFGYNGDMTND